MSEQEMKDVSGEYSKTMMAKMGSTLVYKHEDGMNYARVSPKLFVGSCLQTAKDVDTLHGEKVGVIFCLQEDEDMKSFGIDVEPIRKRAGELGIAHVREAIKDFDPQSIRRRLPAAVRRLARELEARSEGESAYIHCTAGLGRAPGTALAYMFWVDGRCLDEAYGSILEVRRCHPQLGMIRAATCDILSGEESGLGSLIPIRIEFAQDGASVVQIKGLDVGWKGEPLCLEKDPATGRFVLSRGLPAPPTAKSRSRVRRRWNTLTGVPGEAEEGRGERGQAGGGQEGCWGVGLRAGVTGAASRAGAEAGKYEYKFIVDGEWCVSRELPTVMNNGNENNVIEVAADPTSPDAERRARIMADGGRPNEEELAQIRAYLFAAAPAV